MMERDEGGKVLDEPWKDRQFSQIQAKAMPKGEGWHQIRPSFALVVAWRVLKGMISSCHQEGPLPGARSPRQAGIRSPGFPLGVGRFGSRKG